MNVMIVDDEFHNIENLERMLRSWYPNFVITGTATGIEDATSLLLSYPPDILFLDIQIGRSNGFDLLKQLPTRAFEVIFVTAFDKYGIQAIKYAALDYILKPIDEVELKTAIQRAVAKWNEKKKDSRIDFLLNQLQNEKCSSKIALPLFQETRFVDVNSIVRCEAQNNYTIFHLSTKEKILISRPLKEYDDLLGSYHFIRCHQTHLVNPAFVKSLLKEDGGCLVLLDGEKIPVSKTKRDIVKMNLEN